jgi:L-threonylcarbamoyladenylate synthase
MSRHLARRVPIDPLQPDPLLLDDVRRHLDAGGAAAVPTDTLYGLAANALDAAAVERVFELKGREAGKPLPVVVRDADQAAELAQTLPPLFHELTAAFWPGPLTLIVAARAGLPPALTAGQGTIAMRQPALRLLDALLRATGYPLTATSANLSGQPACRTAAEVERQLGAALDLIVDGGTSPAAVPSTMVDLSGASPRLLREGAVPRAVLARFIRVS